MNPLTKSQQERIDEFLKYHRDGDGECNGILLKACADSYNLNEDERFYLALFYAITYCIPSSFKMLKERDYIYTNPQSYAKKNKDKLIFQSDRRYMRCNNLFEKTLNWLTSSGSLRESFEKDCISNRNIDIQKAIDHVRQWTSFGRFASYLFIETLVYLFGYDHTNTRFDWNNGDTATSGMLNLLCCDKEADYFDKNDRLPSNVNIDLLDLNLQKLIKAINATGGNDNISCIETSLCAYRKFFKGSRYNGYYLDRQLEEIHWHIQSGIEIELCKTLLRLRKELFDGKYLGELNNWKGIRKNLKRLYKDSGVIA